MLLYHGSFEEILLPKHNVGRSKLDFGQGFYTTTIFEQAKNWAEKVAARNSREYESEFSPVVSVYEYDQDNHLIERHFENYTEDWLHFVVENRRADIPKIHHGFDIVSGPIADDRVIDTIDYYIQQLISGRATRELLKLTLQELSFQQKNDQFCFCSDKLNSVLTFIEAKEV